MAERAHFGLSPLLVSAILALGACGSNTDEQVVDARGLTEPIIESALTDSNEWVRAEAVRLVGQVPERVAEAEYARFLNDPSVLVRSAALEALLKAGSPAARDSAMRGLVAGTPQQRIQLLDLVADSTNDALKRDALLQAIRDSSPEVRRAAIERLERARVALTSEYTERLLGDSDPSVVEAMVGHLARTSPEAATTAVLTRLRNADAAVRADGMMLASSLSVPALWPQMRSLARRGTPEQRTRAILALGRLGDPTVESDLRNMVLNGSADEAARALDALSHVDTTEARQQPARHRRDNRIEVRRAAFDAMVRLDYPFSEFEVFLGDSDSTVVRNATSHMQTLDAARTAQLVASSLAEVADPTPMMLAMYETSLQTDIGALVRASRPQLQQVSQSTNQGAAWLATRLLLLGVPTTELDAALPSAPGPATRYAMLEAALNAPRAEDSAVYREALEHELFLVRLAAALCIWRLNDRYVPEVVGAAAS